MIKKISIIIIMMSYLIGCESGHSSKTAYIQNQYVFDAYAGTKEIQQEFAQLKKRHQYELDSIVLYYQGDSINQRMIYTRLAQQYQQQEAEYSERKTTQLWHQVNEYIKEYGDKHGYDYIFGAVGNGSLMYVAEKHDISEEVVKYLNQRYAGN